MIYFDNASTYLVNNKDVYDVFINAVKEYPGNTSSIHHLGYVSNKKLDDCRKEILKLLNLSNEFEVIFTSSATEGINHAIKGYARKNKSRGNEIICYKGEHSSVLNSVKSLIDDGFIIKYISSTPNGEADINELEKLINKNTIMVCIMSVNNETGAINNLKKAKEIVSKFPKCVLFSDVTQSIGKIDLDYSLLDIFACSAHKFGGLLGSGFLIKKKKIMLSSLLSGGDQENNQRAGTVSLPLALSTTYALKKSISSIKKNYEYVDTLKKYLIEQLKLNKNITINSDNDFPYIVNFSLKNKKSSVLIEGLSNKNIYVSSVSSCDSKLNKISYVLLSMGLDKKISENSVRVSFSIENTNGEIKIFLKEMQNILKEML